MYVCVDKCGTCVLPEQCSRGGHLILLTSSVCIITRLPGLDSRCYESARVTNDHGIALGTHAHTHRHNTDSETPFRIPKRDAECLCLSVMRWVSTRCLAGFSLGGTDSIHSPDNRPVIRSRGWDKLSSEQGRDLQLKKRNKDNITGCVRVGVKLSGTCTQHTAKEQTCEAHIEVKTDNCYMDMLG